MKKYLLFIFIQTAILISAKAQSSSRVLQWINTVNAENHDFYDEIPFEYRNGSIVIKVTIGHKVYDYIFDTGGYNDITDEIQAANNFPVITTQTVGSSNRLKTRVNLVKVDSMKIGPLVFRDVMALQMNFHHSPTVDCTINGALIGASIIKKYIWQIDYPNRKIIVTDRLNRLPHLDKATRVPVTFNSRLMPYVMANLDGQKEKFMLDLGSSTLVVLTEKTAQKYLGGKQIIEIDGSTSEGGNGVVQQTIHAIKADAFEIGDAMFKNTPVYCLPSGTENLIGNPVIKNYIVTLNFPANELYLTPATASPVGEGLETFGFSMKYEDGKTVIAALYKGLAADRAGLRIGDNITAVDGKQLAFTDQCAALGPLSALLASKREITLTISKDGKTNVIHLSKVKVF